MPHPQIWFRVRLLAVLLTLTGWASVLPGLPGEAVPRERVADARGEATAEGVPDIPKGPQDLRALEKKVRDVVAKGTACTVGVGGGSGVLVSGEGHVLTVAHVIQRAGRTIRIRLPDGRNVRAETLGMDTGLDAGLARIVEDGPWPHMEMGESSSLRRGQWCIATGYPVPFRGGRGPAVRVGRVLRQDGGAIVTDCAIMGGDSGGPVFDLDGRVIGVSSRCDQNVTRNVHVPVDVYRSAWDRLVSGEEYDSRRRDSPPSGFLGISSPPDTLDARVGSVVSGSAAEKAGLQAGDLIVAVDGAAVKSFAELRSFLTRKKPDDRVKVTVERDGEQLELEVTLGRRQE